MKDIDWKILKILYEKKSITKAAEDLFVTQSALTKRLKAIEEEWGVEIVKRSSKGVLFTDDGRYLVQKSDIMLDFLNEIREHFSGQQTARELLRLGVPNSFARLHLPRLIKQYVERYDRLQFQTYPNSSDILIRLLMDGSIDMGIVCGDYPYLGEKVCLFDEALFVMTRKGLKLDDIEHMPVIESFLNPMVKLLLNQWWKDQFGSTMHAAHIVPYADIAIEMVENGLGNCFLFGSEWNLDHEGFQLIPIYDKDGRPISRRVWMMISDRCCRSREIMNFVTFAEEYYHVN